MLSRPRTTVAFAASVIGSSNFKAPGGDSRTISLTCKFWVGNIRESISGRKADESPNCGIVWRLLQGRRLLLRREPLPAVDLIRFLHLFDDLDWTTNRPIPPGRNHLELDWVKACIYDVLF